jgi:EpsI family protein
MIPNRSFIIAVVLLVVAGTLSGYAALRPIPVVVATNLENIPMALDGYQAVDDTFPESVYTELNADKHVYRHYKASNGDNITLYIGYYGTAKGGRTGHNPYACLPSSGSAIVDTGTVYLKQTIGNQQVPVNYILSRKDGVNFVMLHWYQTAGKKVVSTGVAQNVERFTGRILHNRNDGAFVEITAAATDAEIPKIKQRVDRFSELILNILPRYWPVEK